MVRAAAAAMAMVEVLEPPGRSNEVVLTGQGAAAEAVPVGGDSAGAEWDGFFRGIGRVTGASREWDPSLERAGGGRGATGARHARIAMRLLRAHLVVVYLYRGRASDAT